MPPPLPLVGEILGGLFRLPFRESFCAFVTCPVIIALMLALAVRLTAEALKGNLPFSNPEYQVIEKFDRMYVPLHFYTKGREQSRILLIQQRRRLSKRLSFICGNVSTSEFCFIAL